MSTNQILGNPQANLPTLRVAARAIHRFGPMESEELCERLRPAEYLPKSSNALVETLTVAGWLGLIRKNDNANPKLELGETLSQVESWFNSPSQFALCVLRQLLARPDGTEVASLIPWFVGQDWRRDVEWSRDTFARTRINNATQANAFFDRWMIPLGLSKPARRSPNPVDAISWILPSLSGRYTGIAFVRCLADVLPTGPAHPLALELRHGEDASQFGEVFPSVAFALLQLEHFRRIKLIRADDAAGGDRLIFRSFAGDGYTNITHVEINDG